MGIGSSSLRLQTLFQRSEEVDKARKQQQMEEKKLEKESKAVTDDYNYSEKTNQKEPNKKGFIG